MKPIHRIPPFRYTHQLFVNRYPQYTESSILFYNVCLPTLAGPLYCHLMSMGIIDWLCRLATNAPYGLTVYIVGYYLVIVPAFGMVSYGGLYLFTGALRLVDGNPRRHKLLKKLSLFSGVLWGWILNDLNAIVFKAIGPDISNRCPMNKSDLLLMGLALTIALLIVLDPASSHSASIGSAPMPGHEQNPFHRI